MKAPAIAVATEEALVAECVAAWESRQQRLQNPYGEIPLWIMAAAVGLRQVPDPGEREAFDDGLARVLDAAAERAASPDSVRVSGELFCRLVARMTERDLGRWRTNTGRALSGED